MDHQPFSQVSTLIRYVSRGGNWITLFGLATLAFCLSGCGARSGAAVVELSAQARFEKPAEWTWVAAEADGAHVVALGPRVISRDLGREDEIRPNINAREVSFDGGPERLADWIERNMAFTTNTFTVTRAYNTKAGQQQPFITDDGVAGTRVAIRNDRFHKPLEHVQYFFLIEETIHVLTFTRPVGTKEENEALDALADHAARSFK